MSVDITACFNGRENWNFTWKFGRQLTGASSGSKAVSYAYDVDGIRQSKTVNGSTTKFTTLDGKVVRETWGNITTDCFYDNEGKPYKLEISGNSMNFVGYYVLNQQGDVIAILDDAGNVAVTYEYNAWGKILDETGSGTLVSLYLQFYNHLKYRGYYHDTETGFYYLNSRYYDPVIGRFITADDAEIVLYDSLSVSNKNLYAYCDNNPANRIDIDGYMWELVLAGGGSMASGYGISMSAILAAISSAAPVILAVVATVAAVAVVYNGIEYAKTRIDSDDKETEDVKAKKPKKPKKPSK